MAKRNGRLFGWSLREGRSVKRIVVTGGVGFIGSSLVDGLAQAYPEARIVVLDAMTYAARRDNLTAAMATGRVELQIGDITDAAAVDAAVAGADLVVHAAAESHVDRSFTNADVFLKTNVLGTHRVLEAARAHSCARVIHVSTDEVYGPRTEDDEADEADTLCPTNPYSASKAAAEMVALAAYRSFGLPVTIIRPNNIFGPRQYPEKLLPRFILAAARGEALTIHGSGLQRRRFLAVDDLVAATLVVIAKGEHGTAYNIGIADSYTIHDVVALLGDVFGTAIRSRVTMVEDRPYNDPCYATRCDRISALGWAPRETLRGGFSRLAADTLARHAQREDA